MSLNTFINPFDPHFADLRRGVRRSLLSQREICACDPTGMVTQGWLASFMYRRPDGVRVGYDYSRVRILEVIVEIADKTYRPSIENVSEQVKKELSRLFASYQ